MKRVVQLFSLLVLLLAPAAVVAQTTFTAGDIVVTGRRLVDGRGVIALYRPDGTFVRTLLDSFADYDSPIIGPDRLLYVAAGPVFVFDTVGNPIRTLAIDGLTASSISFDAAGRIYVSTVNQRLFVFAPGGERLAVHHVPRTLSGGSDLARNQCTLYLGTTGTVETFNVCANTFSAAPAPALPGDSVGDLRVLPDGNVLVANWSAGAHVMTPTGTILRTYPPLPPRPFVLLALDPTRASFWTSVDDAAIELDLASGAQLRSFATGIGITGIAVAGEPRAALAAATDVPAVSPGMLVALALILAVLASTRLR